jgi:hypothetical protein
VFLCRACQLHSGGRAGIIKLERRNSMSGPGKKDKGNKEQKKKPKHNLKEKRKLKKEKQNK